MMPFGAMDRVMGEFDLRVISWQESEPCRYAFLQKATMPIPGEGMPSGVK